MCLLLARQGNVRLVYVVDIIAVGENIVHTHIKLDTHEETKMARIAGYHNYLVI